MIPALCLLDGKLLPPPEARVSPFDRGFLFGDGVYEGLKILDGRILFRDRHLERLAQSLRRMRIVPPGGLAGGLRDLVSESGVTSGMLYLQVTRGVAPQRSHLPPPDLRATVFAFAAAHEFAADPASLPGLAAVTRPDDRWAHCDVKSVALAASVLAKLEAAEENAAEAIFVGAEGALREGGNTSLFARDAAGWHTHPNGPEILPGVTRAVLLELAAADGVEVTERAPQLGQRNSWQEAFLCGSITGVRGLTLLDREPVANGEVGAETREFARRLAAAELREASA